MQDAAEPGRLEELRRRAYGRGASLTADEAAELHDLEQQARAQRAAERPPSPALTAAAAPAAAPVHVAAHPESAQDADAQPPSGDADTPQDPAPQATVTDTADADASLA